MIRRLIDYSLFHEDSGSLKVIEKPSSLTFKYPCDNPVNCTPYKLILRPSVYKFECWGSIGKQWDNVSKPGKGAYTSGKLFVSEKTEMFIYIGTIGFFNSMKEVKINRGHPGGGATDVRLHASDDWWDLESLKSRIMVAAGGGGAEWAYSVGGNGGELTGNASISAKSSTNPVYFNDICAGPTQTSGRKCSDFVSGSNTYENRAGSFGSAGVLDLSFTDWGGAGGGGYYGGSSYHFAFAGSGGSSFISGHEGCNALNRSTEIQHSNTPFHYSGFVFTETKMIAGNQSMPLPFSHGKGIWESEEGGAFKITLISLNMFSCYRKRNTHLINVFYMVMLS